MFYYKYYLLIRQKGSIVYCIVLDPSREVNVKVPLFIICIINNY